jgi:hypothetical protein
MKSTALLGKLSASYRLLECMEIGVATGVVFWKRLKLNRRKNELDTLFALRNSDNFIYWVNEH